MTGHEVMSTATGELVYQLTAILISVVTTVVGAYAKKWLQTNAFVKEYDLYNKKVENVLNNAINYAEEAAKKMADKEIRKKDLAYKYIEKISPDIIEKEGDKLELMIDRKVRQVLKK